MTNNYDFSQTNGAWKSLYHLINQYDCAKVIEIGVGAAESLCSLASQCKNIKELHGVDNWQNHIDLKYKKEGEVIDTKRCEYEKLLAYHYVKFSNERNKIFLHCLESKNAASRFCDGYFDFVLVDSYMNSNDVFEQLTTWLPKVKTNGYLAGHDWDTESVQSVVKKFANKNDWKLSSYDNVWLVKVDNDFRLSKTG